MLSDEAGWTSGEQLGLSRDEGSVDLIGALLEERRGFVGVHSGSRLDGRESTLSLSDFVLMVCQGQPNGPVVASRPASRYGQICP